MEIAWQGRLLVQVFAHRIAEQEVLGSIPAVGIASCCDIETIIKGKEIHMTQVF